VSRFISAAFAPVLLASLSLPAQAAPAKAASGDVLPFKATEKTLANGLKIIVVPTGLPNLVSVTIPVQTGSRNEVEPGKSGFAHFFEHMMFRGTKAYPPEKYQEIITRAGARQNAYTSDDLTNYYTTFAKEDLETVLKVEADRFQQLDYPIEAFKTESRAVLGEYNTRTRRSPWWRNTGRAGRKAAVKGTTARRCRPNLPRAAPCTATCPGRRPPCRW
jgi:zinc protease